MPKLNKAELDELLRQQWLRQRSKGKLRYIVMQGGLGWGLPFCVFYGAFQVYFRHDSLIGSPLGLIVFVSMCLFLGCPFGWSLWNSNEKRYKINSLHSNDNNSPST